MKKKVLWFGLLGIVAGGCYAAKRCFFPAQAQVQE